MELHTKNGTAHKKWDCTQKMELHTKSGTAHKKWNWALLVSIDL
jgi:hypothetical protein